MSPTSSTFRQGLPRVAGGDPWPPVTEVVPQVEPVAPPVAVESDVAPQAPEVTSEVVADLAPAVISDVAPASATPAKSLRQGLPRIVDGQPWPPAQTLVTTSAAAPARSEPVVAAPVADSAAPAEAEVEPDAAAAEVAPASTTALASPIATGGESATIRRGLPRVADGEAWPPSSFIASAPSSPASPAPIQPPVEETKTIATPPAQVVDTSAAPVLEPQAQPEVVAATTAPAPSPTEQPVKAPAKPAAQAPAAAPSKPTTTATPAPTKTEPKRHGPLTTKQWVLASILGAFCALGMATAVVLVARGIASIDAVAAFIDRYPGEYHLPESAPVGVPAWLAWNHFFNFFLMVLIIRSGMLVRHQKKPPAYWSSKRSPKVSINLWLHQSLDLLWIINGLVFVIVLFATGHWMRIIPTSWEVFPNALSAALQYLSLDWPTENGWVNYNSLQQLAYFVTVFIAAPLAAITGFRLSAFWPKNPALSKRYPIEWARALHFPTMLYFVLFILVHVILVFSTGALRNLNHMYAAQGSTDPTAYADNWAGLLYFALSLLVIMGAWIACRPMVLASIARFFGKVSSR